MRLRDTLADLVTEIRELRKEIQKMSSDQEHLDTDVAELTAAVTAIAAEIANLKTANPAVDFTALDAVVASVQGLEPPAAPAPTP